MVTLRKTDRQFVINFDRDNATTVDVYASNDIEYGLTISRLLPRGDALLIAEVGMVGMMELLNYHKSNIPIKAKAKLIVAGVSPDINQDLWYDIGDRVLLKMRDSHLFRSTFDPDNEYSFERLLDLATSDPELLAATSIVANKEVSRVGLRLPSEYASKDTLDNLSKNRNLKDLIYKDKVVPFLNFKLTDYHNIDAVICNEANIE